MDAANHPTDAMDDHVRFLLNMIHLPPNICIYIYKY